ncbi:MAG: hypothetical protein ACE5OS_02255 [Anaerolineae bacterium]
MAKKAESKKGPVSCPGELLEGGGEGLSDDEQALLLALLSVDAEAGEGLDEEQRAALDELRERLEGYDPEDLARAVKHVVRAKSRRGRKLEWPELKRRRR